ncbi:hypothetical protein SmJEL517_g06059 [Synchytrium microbalum]|uniref:Pentacotripeptide-repeat region of PRORP domain-containing protein n=1 Tax=Synchytrium microbalum TaxID=1806994 RepID=A0A507BSC3_9FUNG|nr:uncharacterized protein SmJEL517_g06059 [Synchytrium microbalum]TPX30358.1 hypothetical protein SmJEL517_g06059 [Synchytrium microbalum]
MSNLATRSANEGAKYRQLFVDLRHILIENPLPQSTATESTTNNAALKSSNSVPYNPTKARTFDRRNTPFVTRPINTHPQPPPIADEPTARTSIVPEKHVYSQPLPPPPASMPVHKTSPPDATIPKPQAKPSLQSISAIAAPETPIQQGPPTEQPVISKVKEVQEDRIKTPNIVEEEYHTIAIADLEKLIREHSDSLQRFHTLGPDGEYQRHMIWKTFAKVVKQPKQRALLTKEICLQVLAACRTLRVAGIEDRMNQILNICNENGFNIGRLGYHSMLAAIARRGDRMSTCDKVLNDMSQAGVFPTQRTYSLYLLALINIKGIAEGEKWLEDAVGRVAIAVTHQEERPAVADVEDPADLINDNNSDSSTTQPSNAQSTRSDTFRRDSHVDYALLHGYYRERRYRQAIELTDSLRSQSLDLPAGMYYILLKVYIRMKDLNMATQIFAEMQSKGFIINRLPYEAMIQGWLSLLDPKKGLTVKIDGMADNLLRSSEFSHAENSQTVLGPVSKTALKEQHIAPSIIDGTQINNNSNSNSSAALNIPTGTDGETYCLQKGSQIYQDMVAANIEPGINTYQIFMAVHLRQQQYGAVMALYRDLLASNLHPNVVVYTSAMTAAAALHDWSAVDKMFDAARHTDEGYLDVHIYTTYMSSLTKSGRADQVEKFFEQMKRERIVPTLYTWDALLQSKCAMGDLVSAQKIVSQIESHGWSKNLRIRNSLLYGLCVAGDLKGAGQTFDQMRSDGLTPDVTSYNILLWGHNANGDVESGLAWYSRLIADGLQPDVATFNILIAANAHRLDAAGAMDAFQSLVSNNLKPDVYSLVPLMAVHARRGNVNLAKDGLALLQQHEICATPPFNIIMSYRSRQNDLKALVDEYCRVTQGAQGSDAVAPDIRTFDILVRAFGIAGDVVNAQFWFDEAAKFNIVPDAMLYNALLSAYTRAGDFEGAGRVHAQMAENGVLSWAVTNTFRSSIAPSMSQELQS